MTFLELGTQLCIWAQCAQLSCVVTLLRRGRKERKLVTDLGMQKHLRPKKIPNKSKSEKIRTPTQKVLPWHYFWLAISTWCRRYIIIFLKVRYFRKDFLVFSDSSKKGSNKFVFSTISQIKRIQSFNFWKIPRILKGVSKLSDLYS